MKPTQLDKEQIKALLKGASILMLPIPENLQKLKPTIRQIKSFISMFSPLQTGEEYFVQEPFTSTLQEWNIVYGNWGQGNNASQMKEHQSRLKFKVIEVAVKDNNFIAKVEVY